jgi:drug/metabolite transporter (DMT)-like permease
MPFQIPWIPVLAAAAAFFVLGAVWYSYFGDAWLRAIGKRKEDLNPKDPTPYITAAIACFLNALATALVIGWVAPFTDSKYMTALLVGLLLGGAVFAAGLAKHYAFAGKGWNLLAIDAGHDIVGFLLMSLMIALMRP